MKIYGLGRISEIPPEPKLNYVPCALSLPLPSLPYVAFDLGDEHASKARLPRATHCHITLVASQFSPWYAERRKMFYGERVRGDRHQWCPMDRGRARLVPAVNPRNSKTHFSQRPRFFWKAVEKKGETGGHCSLLRLIRN